MICYRGQGMVDASWIQWKHGEQYMSSTNNKNLLIYTKNDSRMRTV